MARTRQSVRSKKGDDGPQTEVRRQARVTVKASGRRMSDSTDQWLNKVSPEVLELILDQITEKEYTVALSCTCKALYALLMPRLHRRVIISANHYPQIPDMIRTVEPYLSINQRREIRKMGQYKGQQETYPDGVDEDKVPDIAKYVQELVIDQSSPGKKHIQIVHRYIEEFTKNVKNIRVLGADMLTSYIAKGIACWKQLTALSIVVEGLGDDLAPYLADIRDLEHLHIKRSRYGLDRPGVIQDMLQNSASTLKTLYLQSSGLNFLETALFAPQGDQPPATFGALDLVDFHCPWVSEEGVDAMLRAVDFTRLSEIKLNHVEGKTSLLYQPLTSLFAAASKTGGVKLRRLLMNSSYIHDAPQVNSESEETAQTVMMAFLSSFSDLRSLEIASYGMYPRDSRIRNSGYPKMFIDAILKHRELRTLKISNWTGSTNRILYLTPDNFSAIFNGLPTLEHFTFSPDEWNMDTMGRCLTQGNLSSITCNIYELRWVHDKTDPRYMTNSDVMMPILTAYLEYQGPDWLAKMSKLETISVGDKRWQRWQISTTKFPKNQTKGRKALKAATRMKSENGKREVWYREVAVSPADYQGYVATVPWIDKVTKYR